MKVGQQLNSLKHNHGIVLFRRPSLDRIAAITGQVRVEVRSITSSRGSPTRDETVLEDAGEVKRCSRVHDG